MAGAIVCNIGAALLDAFSLALLIPFLNTLFDQPPIGFGAENHLKAADVQQRP